LYYHFKKGGSSSQRLNRDELLLCKVTQFDDPKQFLNTILKYTIKITNMEREEIFGSHK
jgi:hypothetical protein